MIQPRPRALAGTAAACLFLVVLAMAVTARAAGSPRYDPSPWLEDLGQARTAFATKYADLEWDVLVRKVDLSRAFSETRQRLLSAHDEQDARAAFNDLALRFGDRHVHFQWASPRAPDGLSCTGLGYSPQMQAAPLATLIPGFVPLDPVPSERFPAGILSVGAHRVGVLKIELFSPRAFPVLCEAAISALRIEPGRACDAECADRIEAAASKELTGEFAATLRALSGAGADVLLVDVAGNGGGSEWAEAAARMVTAVRLNSLPMYFMKGDHWAVRLGRKEEALRSAARSAADGDAQRLTALADLVHARKRDAETPCDGSPLWKGEPPNCAWLGDGFYSTGLLRSADPSELREKTWGTLVFTPMQYPYEEGLWRGPLVVLVDGGTGSAAEQFAAELQDNRAAVIMGAHTVGAGCGYTDGGTPTTLANSRAILKLPDCVRLRADGTNAAGGMQPDVPVALRLDARGSVNAQRVREHLAEAVRRAQRQHAALSAAAR